MKIANSLIKRTITGVCFVFTLVGCILFNSISFAVLFSTITALGVWEFYRIIEKENSQPQKYSGTIISVAFFAVNYFYSAGLISTKIFLLFIPLLLTVPVVELFRKKEHPFTNIAFTLLGLIYISVPLSFLNYLVINHESSGIVDVVQKIDISGGIYTPQILLGFLILIWSSDTGAYISGSLLGKHSLFKRISPKKTWEGSIGGAIFAGVIGWILSIYFPVLTLTDWIVISLIAVITGTLGDLVESLLKRSINIKDSGVILPGHGGILDRFDSVLLSTPLVFFYLKFF